jgi:hypothetical protein
MMIRKKGRRDGQQGFVTASHENIKAQRCGHQEATKHPQTTTFPKAPQDPKPKKAPHQQASKNKNTMQLTTTTTTILTALTLLLQASTTTGVTIANYANRDCRGAARVCTNLAAMRCCSHPGRVYQSSRFTQTDPVSISVVCTGTANSPCGTAKATLHGQGCLQHGQGTTRLRGSYVFSCLQVRTCKRAVEELLVGDGAQGLVGEGMSVLPDKLVLDGRVFEINGNVTQADSEALEALADADVKYDQIPKELLVHEVTGPAAKAVLGSVE